MIELLNASNIEYSSFNILSDEEVRQGTYHVWGYLYILPYLV